MAGFEVICEIEPPASPDLGAVLRQVETLAPVASAFLVPDNHVGRATVSSIAVAREIAQLGVRAITCLNARDRNTLGVRRDFLTVAAYRLEELLFVYGDAPESGQRSEEVTVRSMLEEARHFAGAHPGSPLRIGVASGLSPLAPWKQGADALFVQVCFSFDELVQWRRTIDFAGRVYAAVMVVTNAGVARKLSERMPQLAVPPWLLERLDTDGDAGVAYACELARKVRDCGLFDGVHLIPLGKRRELVRRLQCVLDEARPPTS